MQKLKKKEREKIAELEEKIKKDLERIKWYERSLELAKNSMRSKEKYLYSIWHNLNIRRMKKCRHEMRESVEYDTCGRDWCGYSDYHHHMYCWKCNYVEDEPLEEVKI